ncbi:F-box and WD-40 domain-containing protein CDC4 [Pseudogymnoascus sp. 23342-1-I1]|nr:F-box and WD-40 domain-containing protein CDC4 [Pseudogymnoascus sp. 23342-1-I1]
MDPMDGLYRSKSLADRRASMANSEEGTVPSPTRNILTLDTLSTRMPARVEKIVQTRPRGPPTPNLTTPAELDSPTHSNHDPPPPPTPAASPGPDNMRPDWSAAGDQEDIFLAQIRQYFKQRSGPERTRILGDLLNLCTSQQLSFVSQYVSPLLKKDPFTSLPDELCLRVLSFIDDGKVLARASQVSRRWRDLLADDMTWKNLCERHDYRRRLSVRDDTIEPNTHIPPLPVRPQAYPLVTSAPQPFAGVNYAPSAPPFTSHSRSFDTATAHSKMTKRPPIRSHKSYFKQRYLVETAWRAGGHHVSRHITQDQGVVTSLHLTPKYIVVALDNAKIHVFDTDGDNQKTLQGHVMGVWAMVPWGDTLVSGGCDRDVRVWDMATGESRHTLRGHTSTVRCLKMSDANTAISGSRDTTLRIWDIKTGLCKNVLVGHLASVRCLEIHGDIVVSGSYDTTARVWSISEGRCLRTLNGHFSQIYAIAFDGKRIATGSLDTSVRIWDPENGTCQAILQGHTSLVGQLQMRGNTLVTGGSDGSVRVWSLEKMAPIHRLAAHDNSVTSLQFDDNRVVSGGSDGRVKVWDLKTGHLVRELTAPADAVWRVAFEEEKCVVMASRSNRTIMEVWSFSPPLEATQERQGFMHNLPPRPLSETGYRFTGADENMTGLDGHENTYARDDIDMEDAGPSTAPPRPRTFLDD